MSITGKFSIFEVANFEQEQICLIPVPRLLLNEDVFQIGRARIYPMSSLDYDEIRLVSWPQFEWQEIQRKKQTEFSEMELEWAKSANSQISKEDFSSSDALVAFPIKLDWEKFLSGNHNYHKSVLREATEIAEMALDVIKLDFCRLDLSDTLPGTPGSIGQGNAFSTAIFYSNNADHESYMISGQILTHTMVAGLGLEISKNVSMTNISDGETGGLLKTAISLRSQALEANNNSSKFILAMRVIDFLCNPLKYTNHEQIGKIVARHMAKTRQEYDPILRRFEQLTGGKGGSLGIRTRIVHMGHRLEDILLSEKEKRSLFLELDRYICKMISDILPYSDQNWNEVEKYRNQRMAELGLI